MQPLKHDPPYPQFNVEGLLGCFVVERGVGLEFYVSCQGGSLATLNWGEGGADQRRAHDDVTFWLQFIFLPQYSAHVLDGMLMLLLLRNTSRARGATNQTRTHADRQTDKQAESLAREG